MKKILILLIGISIISCNQTQKEKQEDEIKSPTTIQKSENFDWLLGKWKRLKEEEGKETFENWNKITETEYFGIGFTMQNGDTIKQEKIRLKKINGKWDLTVKDPEESQTIIFKGISHDENQFTCENNEIEFPNKIKYWRNGNRINATVSGGEMEILFEFEKLNN
jgi:hypothetical protein